MSNQHMRNPVPPRLLQIALDGAEARSVEAGTGPLGYRDCAVIVNGVRPVLADLRGKVQALRDDEAEVARKGRSDARCFVAAYEVVLTLLDEGETEPPTDMDVWNRTFGSSK